ncbi:MiaB/RimO family radical SAM methylthiotransferase [Lentisphaerota bacterium WC36G]|nr:MiaB/RimO family radical SAM methylthiotransferase [Lentisphaerae bacterium WC36]
MKIFIKTYGCQMNLRDSEATAGELNKLGHEIVYDENEADVFIFNTCSVREKAELKAVGKIGILKKLKKKKPNLIIGIMGCMAQNKGEELLKELPHVNFVVGTGQLHKVPELITNIIEERDKKRKQNIAKGLDESFGVGFDEASEEILQNAKNGERRMPRADIQEVLLENDEDVLESLNSHFDDTNSAISAFVAVTRGCNRFCSYCIVPYVRGREISRTIEDVVNEVTELTVNGIKEVMLLGQNVAAFGLKGDTKAPAPENSPFADLLTELCKIDKLKRIRFVSPYPSYFNEKLINVLAKEEKICHNIHLPFQSGSDRVLKAMNRQYTAEQYKNIIDKIKTAVPDVTFSTDIIVGFPGETDEDFAKTREVFNYVGFDNAYIFKYSPREGTKAAELTDLMVSEEVKEERNQILLNDLTKITEQNNADLCGSVVEILVEGASKRNSERWSGRTSTNKVVIFPPTDGVDVGDIVNVKIDKSSSMSLFGKVVF